MAQGASRYTGGLPRWVYKALSARTEPITDFKGGLNLRDWPAGLASNELLQATNVELELDGPGVSPCDGTGNRQAPAGPAAGKTILRGDYSEALGAILVQMTDGTWFTTTDFITYTAANGAGVPVETSEAWWVDFNGAVVVGCPTQGIFILTAALAWSTATTTIKPTMLAVWQNKVWAIDGTVRLWACNAGNAATWTTATDWVDIREPNDRPLLALIASQNQDYQGRPALLVYKHRSVHRINSANATTGFSYTTLGVGMGCWGKKTVRTAGGLVYAMDRAGIWATDGLTVPKKMSAKIEPIFQYMRYTLGGIPDESLFPAAVVDDGRIVLFGVPEPTAAWSATGSCKTFLVFYPELGAFTIRRFGSTNGGLATPIRQFFTSRIGNFAKVWGIATDASGGVYNVYAPGSGVDVGGVVLTSVVQTPFYTLGGGYKFNARRVRVRAKLGNDLSCQILADWAQTAVSTRTLAAPGSYVATNFDLWSAGGLKPRRAISLLFTVQASNPAGTGGAQPNFPSLPAGITQVRNFVLTGLFFQTTGAGLS